MPLEFGVVTSLDELQNMNKELEIIQLKIGKIKINTVTSWEIEREFNSIKNIIKSMNRIIEMK